MFNTMLFYCDKTVVGLIGSPLGLSIEKLKEYGIFGAETSFCLCSLVDSSRDRRNIKQLRKTDELLVLHVSYISSVPQSFFRF